jgi:hypothetical protein
MLLNNQEFKEIKREINKYLEGKVQWYTPAIWGTQKAEIGRMAVQGSTDK